MTDKLLIKRELLEDLRDAANDCLNHEIMRGNDRNVPAYTELVEQADMALAAPRQPEGEGLEVVAWLGGNGFHTEEKEATGAPLPLCHLSDAQRAIAMREECEHLKACQENDMLHMTGLVAERDTMRRQIAERDAEIERWKGTTEEMRKALANCANKRDKLAGLLREVMAEDSVIEVHGSDVCDRIDAALAEVNK